MIEVASILFMALFGIYMVNAYDCPFWNSFIYAVIFSYVTLLEIELIRHKKINRYVGGAVATFTAEQLIFWLLIINKDSVTFHEYVTSLYFTLVFVASIIVLLFTVIVYDRWKMRSNGQ